MQYVLILMDVAGAVKEVADCSDTLANAGEYGEVLGRMREEETVVELEPGVFVARQCHTMLGALFTVQPVEIVNMTARALSRDEWVGLARRAVA